MGAAEGSKRLVQDLINLWKIKKVANPALILKKLTDIYNVLEDVYSVEGAEEIQSAIDQIGTGSGTIFIESGTHDIATPIDIDNCGSIVIYGHGDNTVLKPADGITVFNITCCSSLLIKTLKIDASNYTAPNVDEPLVIVNEASDNVVGFSDVTITGLNNFGRGIELQSNNCIVDHCNITFLSYGINITSTYNIISQNIASFNEIGINVSGNYCTITSNTTTNNTTLGIYLNSVQYNNVSINTCNSNPTGISLNLSNNNTISNNITNSNTFNGIYISGSSYNTLSGNICENNDSNSVGDTAGIHILSNSDFNTISANSANNNNNAGAGTGYGILIAAATCDENVVVANNANGNDIDYQDVGTGTTITYYVQNEDELQDAIDSIGTKAGVINLNASFTIDTTIDIDGGGSYIIQGEGSNSTLTTVGDITCFDITSARSCLLQNFKIDASSLTTNTKNIIYVNEVSNNPITIDNITIVGDGANGWGISFTSDNGRILNCNISTVYYGMYIQGSINNIIEGNNCSNNASIGIYNIAISNYNIIRSNILNSNGTGLFIQDSDYCLVQGNEIYGNTNHGLLVRYSSYNNITGNNCISNDSNSPDARAGIYIYDDSNNNSIIGNTSLNNNNAGAGDGHGIYIRTADCLENIIESNNCSGNDIQYWDNGTKTQIVYNVSDENELQDAIDSIAAKNGIINIIDSFNITTTIDVDGGGDYVIQGEGAGTVLTTVGNIRCFDITSARSCLFQNLKIDASSLTTIGVEIISINEAADNIIFINKIEITGDGNNGYGIELNSDNCHIENCIIDNTHTGINSLSNSNIIEGNNCSNNASYGIRIAGGNYNNISSNICTSNIIDGILLYNNTGCLVSGNIVKSNRNGIRLHTTTYNTIEGNICDGNDAGTAASQGGIHFDSAADYNTIISNTSINNNNAGAGISYGILIKNANCDGNIIKSNFCSGNDVNYKDIGTNTDIIYRVSNATDFQDAIDSIAGKAGVIKIVGAIADVQATINNATAAIVIEGDGDISELDANGDNTVLTITTCASLILRDFKIDATDLTTVNKPIIDINGGSNILIDNIIITGDGTNGHGLDINTFEVEVRGCNVSNVSRGIYIVNNKCRIIGNYCHDNNLMGIGLYGHQNLISGNICNNNNLYGIRLYISNYNTITGNVCNENNTNNAGNGAGIWIQTTSTYNIISGNTMYGNVNAGDGTAYGIYIWHANCDFNSIVNNNYSGNDINWLDVGTNTEIEYRCSTGQEIQDAIDSIAAKSGVIHIVSGTINISTTIDVDGGGVYIIEGEGDGSVLTTVGNITCFNISDAKTGTTLKNFKIDASSLTSSIKIIIEVVEVNNNRIIIERLTFLSVDEGKAISLNSENCMALNNIIEDCYDGIEAKFSNSIISGNYITVLRYGIIPIGDKMLISNNYCTGCKIGIYITTTNSLIVGNELSGNYETGIYMVNSQYNTITGNVCNNNDSDAIFDTGGIILTNSCNFISVSGNSCINNNNIGAGDGYGILITDGNCFNNIIRNNTIFGNDIEWKDSGTNTQMEYICTTAQDIQDAIDSIAAKSGIIHIISGDPINVSTTIDIDGGGHYIIEGEGTGTVLTTVGDITCFNITSAKAGTTLKDFKIDATSLTSETKEIITVNEGSDNKITIENINIIGDSAVGYGIALQSNNNIVRRCDINTIFIGVFSSGTYNQVESNIIYTCLSNGINITGNYNKISNNIVYNNDNDGIYVNGYYIIISGNFVYDNTDNGISCLRDFSVVIGNSCYNNDTGIKLSSIQYSTISINNCSENIRYGIEITSTHYCTISGNICNDIDDVSANNGAGIWLEDSDYNTISSNMISNNNNTGAGVYYGIIIDANCDNNIVSSNILTGNDVDYLDNGTGTITMQGGWSGWFDDNVNFRVTVVDGMITAVDNSVAGGHNP